MSLVAWDTSFSPEFIVVITQVFRKIQNLWHFDPICTEPNKDTKTFLHQDINMFITEIDTHFMYLKSVEKIVSTSLWSVDSVVLELQAPACNTPPPP